MRKFLMAALAVCVVAGCSTPAANPDDAERAVPQFHTAFLDGDLAGIYQRASAELQQGQTQQEFVAYLEQVRRNLGEVRSTDRQSAKVEGERVTLTYTSTYAAGPATEEFVIRQAAGKEPELLAYRVLTPALR